MRIRKETTALNWAYFLKVFGIVAAVYSLVLLLDYVGGNGIRISTWINLALYPAMFGSMYAYSQRQVKLLVNDYQNIPEFRANLLRKLEKEGFRLEHQDDETVAYPSSGFRKFIQRWFGSEEITITWGNETTISGSLNRISWVEDVLTWNPDFRYALSAN
jgi:hypothetical protein